MKATLKKTIFIFLLCVLGSLSACTSAPTSVPALIITWQEQYDLGLKYLSEYKYEEAIIAFTAAIELDPQQPEPYSQLIQIYMAQGEPEKAEEVRAQGYAATGSEQFAQSISAGWVYYPDTVPFEQRGTYRSILLISDEQQDFLHQCIETLKTGDLPALKALLFDTSPFRQICTEIDGYRLNLVVFRNSEEYEEYLDGYNCYLAELGEEAYTSRNLAEQKAIIEIRPQSGDGYCYICGDLMGQTSLYAPTQTGGAYGVSDILPLESYITGTCENWQYNGEWSGEFGQIYSVDEANLETPTDLQVKGTAVNNVLALEHATLDEGEIYEEILYQDGLPTEVTFKVLESDPSVSSEHFSISGTCRFRFENNVLQQVDVTAPNVYKGTVTEIFESENGVLTRWSAYQSDAPGFKQVWEYKDGTLSAFYMVQNGQTFNLLPYSDASELPTVAPTILYEPWSWTMGTW